VRFQRDSRARAGSAFPCRGFRARPAGRAFTAIRQAAPGRDPDGLRLAGDRSHVIDTNPAHSVRGPRYTVKKGKTPVLTPEEAHALIESILITKKAANDSEAADQPDLLGLRDRALIAMMVYSFARIGAVIQMKVGDYFVQGRRRWVRLHEKGGKEHDVPCHHRLDQCLHDYIEAAGITDDVDGYLFRTARRKSGQLTTNPLFQQDAHRIIRRRAKAAGIETRIGNHTFRATGITAYLKNSGKLEVAQQIANHESPRTTKLYDRRRTRFHSTKSSESRSKKAGCQDSGHPSKRRSWAILERPAKCLGESRISFIVKPPEY
jgi:integrase